MCSRVGSDGSDEVVDKLDRVIENVNEMPETTHRTRSAPTTRRRQQRADETRSALLDAALHEFAAHGFEGASTRAIASRAGTHQPQINYHFASKDALWRAAVDHLFARLDDLLAEHRPGDAAVLTGRALLAAEIRAFVHAAARLPELNRIMIHESTIDSERLAWIVERHSGPRFRTVTAAWRRLRAAGEVPDIDESIVYYTMVGAASLPYSNAPEARHLGVDTLAGRFVEGHADAMVALLLGSDETDPNDRSAP